VLHVEWWEKQQEIAEALQEHHKVLVKASHSVGKSHVAAGLTNWFFDTHVPSITLTTAPTLAQVEDILWKEVRTQRAGRPGLQPKAPRMETAPNHFAVGYTARDDSAFQGRHECSVLIVFDEGTGIDGPFWDAANGMMTGAECYWLVILNPTDTSSRAYEEELSGNWHVITVRAVDHPNIAAELAGLPAPFPAAVRLAWLEERIAEWCTPVPAGDSEPGDLEFPPGSGIWHRPGPLFESRVLGRWPTQGSVSVWTEPIWLAAITPKPVILGQPLEIGCDVARFGDDYTSILARRGMRALHHETHNGWSTQRTAGRLKQVAMELCLSGEDPKKVPIKCDDDGVGGGVVDQSGDFNFLGVSASEKAIDAESYPNRRSEMWFTVAGRAARGDLDLSLLSPKSLALLRKQAMAPRYSLDSDGRRVVEPKDQTKKRIGRSPDDMDGLNILFATAKKRVWRVG
jgi:hypothetical protein